jgi:hypothetical protein
MKGASFLRVSTPPTPRSPFHLLNSYASCGKFGFANTCKSHQGKQKEKKWSVDEVDEVRGRCKTKKENKYVIQSENNSAEGAGLFYVGGGVEDRVLRLCYSIN